MIDAQTTDPLHKISGADLLNQVRDAIKKYVAFADEHQPVAITLWIAATYALSAWHHATRLAITSPQKRCGKSRLLDVVAALSWFPQLVGNATTAAIFRSIGGDDSQAPTLFFDEADAFFGTKRAAEHHEDLRALLNAGWQRGRPVLRCVGPSHAPQEFGTFAMAGLAAIGRLPDTVTDRAINIGLKRRGPLEDVLPFRQRRDGQLLEDLRDRLSTWVRDENRLKRLAAAEPSMPVEDRAADAWEALMAIADEAGGDWPTKVRAACTALVNADEAADEEQLTSIQLLADIGQVFDDKREPFLASTELVRALWAIADSPWSDSGLTPNRLAVRLRDYQIKPTRDATGSVRGYRLTDFQDAFDRYLRHETSRDDEPARSNSHRYESFDDRGSPDGPRCQTKGDVSDGNRCYDNISDGLPHSGGDAVEFVGFAASDEGKSAASTLDQTAEAFPTTNKSARQVHLGPTDLHRFDDLRNRLSAQLRNERDDEKAARSASTPPPEPSGTPTARVPGQ